MFMSLKTTHAWNFYLECLFSIILVSFEIRWVLLGAIPWASLRVRMTKVWWGAEILLIVHFVVPILQKLIVLLFIIFCCCLTFPVLEFFLQLLIGLVIRLAFSIRVFFLGRFLPIFLFLFIFVKIIQIFLRQSVASFVGFKSVISSCQFLKLDFVSSRFDIWMVDFSELQVNFFELALR